MATEGPPPIGPRGAPTHPSRRDLAHHQRPGPSLPIAIRLGLGTGQPVPSTPSSPLAGSPADRRLHFRAVTVGRVLQVRRTGDMAEVMLGQDGQVLLGGVETLLVLAPRLGGGPFADAIRLHRGDKVEMSVSVHVCHAAGGEPTMFAWLDEIRPSRGAPQDPVEALGTPA